LLSVQDIEHLHSKCQLLVRPHWAVGDTQIKLPGPRCPNLAWSCDLTEAGVVAGAITDWISGCRTFVDAAIRVEVTQAADRHAGIDTQVSAYRPLLVEMVAAAHLQLMTPVVGQIAIGILHHLPSVPILGLGDVVLTELRLHLTLVVTLELAVGV